MPSRNRRLFYTVLVETVLLCHAIFCSFAYASIWLFQDGCVNMGNSEQVFQFFCHGKSSTKVRHFQTTSSNVSFLAFYVDNPRSTPPICCKKARCLVSQTPLFERLLRVYFFSFWPFVSSHALIFEIMSSDNSSIATIANTARSLSSIAPHLLSN